MTLLPLYGLDLIDRVPDELWTEVHDIVQETGIKTIPMENKCKEAKWPSEESLQIAVKRREVKSKGEKKRYKHLNAEFQRIARRTHVYYAGRPRGVNTPSSETQTKGLQGFYMDRNN